MSALICNESSLAPAAPRLSTGWAPVIAVPTAPSRPAALDRHADLRGPRRRNVGARGRTPDVHAATSTGNPAALDWPLTCSCGRAHLGFRLAGEGLVQQMPAGHSGQAANALLLGNLLLVVTTAVNAGRRGPVCSASCARMGPGRDGGDQPVDVGVVPAVRAAIAALTLAECVQVAELALSVVDPDSARALVRERIISAHCSFGSSPAP